MLFSNSPNRRPAIISLPKRLLILTVFGIFILTATTQKTAAQVVIDEVYGGGGNAGAPVRNDFVELYNAGFAPADISGFSIQYASSTGTFGNASLSYTLPANTVIPARRKFLIQFRSNGTVGATFTPDAVASPNVVDFSAANGKIALVNTATLLPAVACPTDASIVDFVGYGTANCSEPLPSATTRAPAGSNTTSVRRTNAVDSNNNANDFTAAAPTPQNSGGTVTAAEVTIGGRVLDAAGNAISRARVSMVDGQGNARSAVTNNFGYYRLSSVPAGDSVVFSVSHKRYQFEAQTLSVAQSLDNLDFIAQP